MNYEFFSSILVASEAVTCSSENWEVEERKKLYHPLRYLSEELTKTEELHSQTGDSSNHILISLVDLIVLKCKSLR
jgi:hypothetical protein